VDKDKHDLFVGRKSLMLPDRDGDPTEGMGQPARPVRPHRRRTHDLRDDLVRDGRPLGSKSTTIVTNPGTKQQTITIKANGTISTYKPSDKSATGAGTALGTIYQLADGTKVFVPAGTSPAATSTP